MCRCHLIRGWPVSINMILGTDIMDIGLNILNNMRISLGDTVENITDSLVKNNINYTIPYSSNNKDGSSNVIIYIESYGVELALQNGIASFIKTSNSKLNYIMQIHNNSAVEVLREIKNNLSHNFNVPVDKIRVDRFEAKTFNSIMSIPYSETKKVKITLIMGINYSIFIETIQLVDA